MWTNMPLVDCETRLNSFEFVRFTPEEMTNFDQISAIATIPSLIMLCIAIIAFICVEGINIDRLRCDKFFIFWLLILALFRPFGRYPQWPYCDGYMFLYQTMFENIGSFGPFLISLVLAYILHCPLYPSTFGSKFDFIDQNKWNILVGVVILSVLFSMIMCVFYLFAYSNDHNYNDDSKNDFKIRTIQRALVFHIVMGFNIVCIVRLIIPVCIPLIIHCCKKYSKLLFVDRKSNYPDSTGELKKSRLRIVGHILGYPLLMMGCFTPGGLKKGYDFYTDYNYPLLAWQYLYLILQALYGFFIACWYLYNSKGLNLIYDHWKQVARRYSLNLNHWKLHSIPKFVLKYHDHHEYFYDCNCGNDTNKHKYDHDYKVKYDYTRFTLKGIDDNINGMWTLTSHPNITPVTQMTLTNNQWTIDINSNYTYGTNYKDYTAECESLQSCVGYPHYTIQTSEMNTIDKVLE